MHISKKLLKADLVDSVFIQDGIMFEKTVSGDVSLQTRTELEDGWYNRSELLKGNYVSGIEIDNFQFSNTSNTVHNISEEDLQQILLASNFMADKDSLRSNCKGVYLYGGFILSSDAHRLYYVPHSIEVDPSEPIFISDKVIKLLKKVDTLDIGTTNNDPSTIFIFTENFAIKQVRNLLVPEFKSVITQEQGPDNITINREMLIEGLESLLPKSGDFKRISIVINKPKKITLIATDNSGEDTSLSTEIDKVEIYTNELKIRFNIEFLLSYLKIVKMEEVTIFVSNPNKPYFINNEFILMPVILS